MMRWINSKGKEIQFPAIRAGLIALIAFTAGRWSGVGVDLFTVIAMTTVTVLIIRIRDIDHELSKFDMLTLPLIPSIFLAAYIFG